jgi:hypothetical protein
MLDQHFSERHGFAPDAAEITIRHDAPYDLRGFVVDFAYSSGLGPHDVRTIVCRVLMARPDDNNWSAFPNVNWEVHQLLDNCQWYEVYDVIEAIWQSLHQQDEDEFASTEQERPDDRFATQVNTFFIKKGIGWQLVEGQIVVRGPEAFEMAVTPVAAQLTEAGLHTAAQEIHEALHDLSRRPDPDITGAIQHSMAAAECVARKAANDPKATLGEILERHATLVPRPLDDGLKKLWGYSSEMARHLREGRTPSIHEAELAVIISAGVVTYLERKLNAEGKSA